MVNELAFVPDQSPTHGQRSWEPVVDGRSLRHILTEASSEDLAGSVVGEYVSVLVHNWPAGMPHEVLQLMGEHPPELASGRIPLYVCPVCVDLGCGAITAALEWTAETVVWRDSAWDVNDETDEDDDDDPMFAGPLIFSRPQYESEVRRFIETFDQVRASILALPGPPSPERTRRWKWPWRPLN
ncbi:hypothetical protein [Actinotalea sp. K2]|uniref:hypothetical protein n=1 Tax=Actinotalea sp. K2 TaxID=2939438 RepID=UPI0020170D99|nr:hypothetical protein [Actinotalea sp. K2]MCL3860648.1 hypothetical protein [Actinotalea sp. K2]